MVTVKDQKVIDDEVKKIVEAEISDDIKSFGTTTFDDHYTSGAFYLWYELGKPKLSILLRSLKPDVLGRLPNPASLTRWRKLDNWDERAATLDQQVRKQVELQAVKSRVEMLNRHAEAGKGMMDSGLDYFKDHPVDNPNIALKFVLKGAELERNSRGIGDAIEAVSRYSDDKLDDTLVKLLGGADQDALEAAMNFDPAKDLIMESATEGEFEDKEDVDGSENNDPE